MSDTYDELTELINHEAQTYTSTFSSLIDLARINNKLKLHELASLLDIKPRTLTEWRAGRKLPHNTKHIAIVSLLARNILTVDDDGQLAINPNPPNKTDVPTDASNPFKPTHHVELQKIIAAKSRPTIKDHIHTANEAIPHAAEFLQRLNEELGPHLAVTFRSIRDVSSSLGISGEEIYSFLKQFFQNQTSQ